MKSVSEAVDYCVRKIAQQRGLTVERLHRSRHTECEFLVTVSRRSFAGTCRMEVDEHRASAQLVLDVVYEHMRRLDMKLRADEIRAVFDFTDDDDLNFVGTSPEESRHIAAQMLRVIMHIVRGDEVIRDRIVETALVLGRSDRTADLVQNKEKQAAIIATMSNEECERLAQRLMSRVERLGRGLS